MRKLAPAAYIVLLALAACQGTDNGTNPDGAPSPYSGAFNVSYFPRETSCALDVPPPDPTVISIHTSTILLGDAIGTWIQADKRGFGTGTIGDNCLNYDPPIVCATCIFISFDITFASPDSFSGTYSHALTYANCSSDSCHTVYFVTGKRQQRSRASSASDSRFVGNLPSSDR